MSNPITEKVLFEVNLNETVYVKIKEEGYKIWHEYINSYITEENELLYRKTSIEELQVKADKNGYVTFHLWEFMSIFGSSLIFGNASPVQTNVYFEVDSKL